MKIETRLEKVIRIRVAIGISIRTEVREGIRIGTEIGIRKGIRVRITTRFCLFSLYTFIVFSYVKAFSIIV